MPTMKPIKIQAVGRTVSLSSDQARELLESLAVQLGQRGEGSLICGALEILGRASVGEHGSGAAAIWYRGWQTGFEEGERKARESSHP